ncbi:hypothetical protein SAMN05661091_5383 [Paenibacillus uliginis N3/975]|uniref:Uncharacterized protein n=1 Tax=Paenibacillus uliginis N3/975 TaxID=1313296 RepID=A0A1X7HSE3_9BACL|nr:hypothetical protein [Paenibacillus uliginis]SMF91229.1 hypothetical protein SAMN05661091_5383 [Paenibacillus uliginis N3/975]
MDNAIWKLNNSEHAIYTEDPEVMRKIRRSRPDFIEMATYEKDGVIYARQYRIDSKRKRSARHLLGVNVQKT